MKKIILSISLVTILSTPLYGQSMTLSTYYPSPLGKYDSLRLIPRSVIAGTSCDIGTFYVNSSDSNLLYFCRDDSIDGEWGALEQALGIVWTQSGDDIYLTDATSPENKKVGIGTSTPEFKLTLDNDGGIIAHGSLGTGDLLTTSGAGARFIWYPRKAALRAGGVDGAQWNNVNIGNHSVAFGYNNQASGDQSTVSGGNNNSVSVQYGTISAGLSNVATISNFTTIGSGEGNKASGAHAFIGSGKNNIAQGTYSTIGSGKTNQANGAGTIILGGASNTIDAATSYAAIIGGGKNTINTNSAYATISGGNNNNIKGQSATIGGGGYNRPDEDYATVAGGWENEASGLSSTVAGGIQNIADVSHATLTGGQKNKASGSYSTVAGGKDNQATGSYAFIGGGDSNEANDLYSTVAGGLQNKASGEYSFVGGGINNTASGNYSVVPGGNSNRAEGSHSWAGGQHMRVTGDRTFTWGRSATDVTIAQNDAFIIYSGNVGIGGITNPSERLHVNGNIRVDNGSIIIDSPPSVTGSPLEIDGGGTLGLDIAEAFEITGEVDMGDLLIVDTSTQIQLKKSVDPYDKKVIGIVSGAPAVLLKGNELQISPKPFTFKDTAKVPIALAGRVLCKVSLENGPIKPGDLLTSSSVPGHAMKAGDRKKSLGTIIARALESFGGGPNGEKTGMITVLVTRQ